MALRRGWRRTYGGWRRVATAYAPVDNFSARARRSVSMRHGGTNRSRSDTAANCRRPRHAKQQTTSPKCAGLDWIPTIYIGQQSGVPPHRIWSPRGSPRSSPTCGDGHWRRTCRPTHLSAPTVERRAVPPAVTRADPVASRSVAAAIRCGGSPTAGTRRRAVWRHTSTPSCGRSAAATNSGPAPAADAARDNARGIAAAGR